MSATALSIILMAIIAGAGLLTAIIAEVASGTPRMEHGYAMQPSASGKGKILRCPPKIIAKCPSDQRPACIAHDGRCCLEFACKKAPH